MEYPFCRISITVAKPSSREDAMTAHLMTS